jgi:hypothetical protein
MRAKRAGISEEMPALRLVAVAVAGGGGGGGGGDGDARGG